MTNDLVQAYIAIDCFVNNLPENFPELSLEDLKTSKALAYRSELEMRRLGYEPREAEAFGKAIIEEDDEKVFEILCPDVLYNMAVEWLAEFYGVVDLDSVAEMTSDAHALTYDTSATREFIEDLCHEITARVIDSVRNNPPLLSEDSETDDDQEA